MSNDTLICVVSSSGGHVSSSTVACMLNVPYLNNKGCLCVKLQYNISLYTTGPMRYPFTLPMLPVCLPLYLDTNSQIKTN